MIVIKTWVSKSLPDILSYCRCLILRLLLAHYILALYALSQVAHL